jgi:trans-2,3-dihydro-3-hydroxyanthranilate isomerase
MRIFAVSVFLAEERDSLTSGNQLAVFPDASDIAAPRMQAMARTLNFSESVFVTGSAPGGYDVRIFTPALELPFAGHPTIGTAWVMSHLGSLHGDEGTQRSAAGSTSLRRREDRWWFERGGTVHDDLDDRDASMSDHVARALGLEVEAVGMEARELGRSGRLRPAIADAGIGHLLVPLRDLDSLRRVHVHPELLGELTDIGAYCFTADGAGRVRARGFFPAAGIAEDPATGSAAAELGLLLADRLGPIDFQVDQGGEINRPCLISVRAGATVEVGGRCGLIFEGNFAA